MTNRKKILNSRLFYTTIENKTDYSLSKIIETQMHWKIYCNKDSSALGSYS